MHLFNKTLTACLTAVLGLTLAASTATAQQRQRGAARDDGRAATGAMELYYPTGEEGTSLLMIRAEAPEEVRVGQSYEYNLTVKNITENVTLEDVRIQNENTTGGASIEGTEVAGQGQQKKAQQGNKNNKKNTDAGIGELKPGESRTVRVHAVAEKEGTAGVCFRVAYTPTICVLTRFVKPEIQVIKEAPKRADICQPLRYEYTVKNTGSADVENVVVRDELSDGLVVEGGENGTIEHKVGNLPAGEQRSFAVDVCATQTGRFASRAVAESGDLRAQSNRPETRVVAAELSASIEGPDAQYLSQPATYRVTVRNDGEGPAMGTVLEVNVDEKTRLVRTSKTSRNSVDPDQPESHRLVWEIGDLKPGQETAVSFTVDMRRAPSSAADSEQAIAIRHVAEVTSRCAEEAAPCVTDEVRKLATAQATAEAELVTLPALLLELVDRYDQVAVGENVDYIATVINQGSGTDHDVQLTVTLPGSLKFVSADGQTEGANDGQTVTFEPIKTLAPGEEARYEVIAKAERAGQVSTRAELASQFLSTPALEEEPTVLIGEGVRRSSSNDDNNRNRNNNNRDRNNDKNRDND